MVRLSNEYLKKVLVKNGLISPEDFESVLLYSKRMGQQVSDVLVSRNFISSGYYNDLLAKYFGVKLADLPSKQIDETVLKLLPEDIARQKRVILFNRRADGSLDAAMNDPTDLTAIKFIENRLGARVNPFLATAEDLNKGLALYGRHSTEDFRKIIEGSIRASLRSEIYGGVEKETALEIPIVSIVNNLIYYATASRASDIHIEILDDGVLVRFRIDGALIEITKIPKEVHPSIIARIKLLSALRLDEHFKPQDGRFRYQSGGELVDIRVAIIPTFYGEKIEMRLLSSAARSLSFEELGMMEDTIKTLKRNISKTYGIVLITGPTGSGKTTTLYSMVDYLNKPEVNICTIEDPIEYDMKYINQTQVNEAAGITFANGLRALLRQDPNIMMVGEIRDNETAGISVQSALTGHLVLSSLHTNDSSSAIPRLFDMKVEPFLVAAVLNAVMAQRLVRKICQDCKESYPASPEMANMIRGQLKYFGLEAASYDPPKLFYRGVGCAACGHIGYKGRLAIFETFNVDEEIRNAIVDKNFTLDALRKILLKKGFVTMFEDGLRKAERGLTTMEEILRVIRE